MPSSTKIRKRGRPRQFDSAVALAAARQTFLRKGYSAATLDDLSSAMGINRPSLYSAFTDKETLYQKSLEQYALSMADLFREILDGEPRIAKALRKLYRAALDAYVAENGDVVGCMAACTAVTEAVCYEPIRQQTLAIFEQIEALVARRLARAIAEGELSKSANARTLSRIVVAMLHSLALRARAGTSRKLLDTLAEDAVSLIVKAG